MKKDKSAPQNDFGDPESTEDLAAIYLSAISNVLSSLRDYEENNAGFASDVMYVLAQAQVRWLTSALRYWTQIATIVSVQGSDAMDALQSDGSEASVEARRLIVLDKARAALREISDMSLSEAKLLQRDLMKIETDLRETLDTKVSDRDAPQRYAKRKE
ncbi:hypothetical protein [Sulfitobacter sp. JB4-11]|uniref:hypothetical protein n=1 Tax=Sulfitobacter rhodophyticola TaxID=3238304 RepID=UPI0035136B25